jgi:hypothetical protein
LLKSQANRSRSITTVATQVAVRQSVARVSALSFHIR